MSQIKAEYVDHMGNDLTVVNAARVSFDKVSNFVDADGDVIQYVTGYHPPAEALSSKDVKLIKYLADHNHWTPFSHAMITLRETVPIFVARQRFKHMVGFTYNEISRRYVDTPPEFYTPDVWRSRPEGSVKQGSGDTHEKSEMLSERYRWFIKLCENRYNEMLAEGVAPEMARMVLPQSMMTSYYVTGSLAAFARAYKQRIADHSQEEIQILAKQWDKIISPLYPNAWSKLIE